MATSAPTTSAPPLPVVASAPPLPTGASAPPLPVVASAPPLPTGASVEDDCTELIGAKMNTLTIVTPDEENEDRLLPTPNYMRQTTASKLRMSPRTPSPRAGMTPSRSRSRERCNACRKIELKDQ